MFLGIDVGTQGVRALVVAKSGSVRGSGNAPLGGDRRGGREHEQTPARWWDALVRAVRDALAEAGTAPGAAVPLDAIALDATSGTVLIETVPGSARGGALMYDDSRASDEADVAQRLGGTLWSQLGYRMQPSWALPKVLWLYEHVGLRPGERIVHQADFLVGALTSRRVATDTSTALKTGADGRDATWPQALHAELGLPAGLLPELVVPGTVLGTVGAEAAAATGLTAGTPIRAGMTDGCAAQIAAGALAPGHWSSALGTTLIVKGSTEQLVRDPSGAVYCHRHPDGGWLPGGASSTGAGIIARTFPGAAAGDLAAMTEAAAQVGPVDGVTFPLAGHGERFPFVAPDAHGFSSLDDGRDVADAVRFAALCQGIAFVERLSYDVLRTLGADTSGPVSLTGGASANMWWNQLRTDVLGRSTLIPSSAQAAFGMAVLAAAEPGRLTETAARMVGVDARLEPDPERGRQLHAGYERLVAELVDRDWLDAELAATALAAPSGSLS